MFGVRKYKRTLKNTTALVAVVMLAAPTGARATDYLINAMNSPFTGPLNLSTGDNVNVTNTGLITGGSTGVIRYLRVSTFAPRPGGTRPISV